MKNIKYTIRLAVALLLIAASLFTLACTAVTEETEGGSAATESVEEPDTEPLASPSVPKAKVRAKTVYVTEEPRSFAEKLLLATLQGLVSNVSEDQILISRGSYKNYSKYLKTDFGCNIQTKVDGRYADVSNLLLHYSKDLSGYILCDSDPDSASGSVAVSLAGLLSAVVATEESEDICKSAGLTLTLDVRGRDDKWLRESEYWQRLDRSIAFEQPLGMAPKLVDYAVMSGAYFSFYDGTDPTEHREKYGFLDKGGVIFGFNNTLGEFDTVDSLSQNELQLIPADHAYNLSTLSGFCRDGYEQKTENTEVSVGKNAHTVCIVLSDGDNLQWLTNDFSTSGKWWDNPARGQFNMGWGLPPAAGEIIAPVTSYLNGTMTKRDEFIMQLSGLGYTFPSRWSASERDRMAEELASLMEKSDLQYAEILDDGGMTPDILTSFTSKDGIEGLFYIDYSNYAGMKGEMFFCDGKPVVSARYRLWADTADGSIEAISEAVNAASTDPESKDSYSFIIVHAWSGLTDGRLTAGGNTLDAVKALTEAFDEDVDVVTVTEFMERIKENKPE